MNPLSILAFLLVSIGLSFYLNNKYSIDTNTLIINTLPTKLPISCLNKQVHAPSSVIDWNAVGLSIAINYDAYKNFVVIYDTDTIIYLYEAFKKSFKHLNKPIVISDLASIEYSTAYRAMKNSITVIVNNSVIKTYVYKPCKITDYTPLNTSVITAVVKVFPGITGQSLPANANNILLDGYYSGELPQSSDFLNKLAELKNNGVNIISLNNECVEFPVCKGTIESCLVGTM